MKDSNVFVTGSGLFRAVIVNGYATISGTTIEADATGPTIDEAAAVLSTQGTLNLDDDTLVSQDPAGGQAQTITLANSGVMSIRDTTVGVNGSGAYSIAVLNQSTGNIAASGSKFQVLAGAPTQQNVGLYNYGTFLGDTTTFSAIPGATSYGVETLTSGTTTIQESQISGGTFSLLANSSSSTKIGGSYVAQPGSGTGFIHCIDDYNQNYAATSGTCT